MSLHYSSGKVLLKNTSDGEWYFVEIRMGSDDLPHLYPHQDIAGDYSLKDYDEYVILRASGAGLYKLDLYTNSEEVVTYRFTLVEAPEKLPIRLFLKDTTTGLLYLVIAAEDEDDGNFSVNITQASPTSGTNTTTSPFRCKSPVSVTVARCMSAVGVFARATIMIPAQVPLPTGGFLLGAGGEGLLDTGGGEEIRESAH
jgi:hypothetical protein